MKTLFTMLSFAAVVVLMAFSEPLKNSSGALPGHTGSPGDNKDCTACHPGTASPVSGVFSSDIPENGYMPGESYTITVTTSGSGRKGFQVSPQNTVGDLLGTLAAGSGNKLVGNNKYVTHSAGVTSQTAEWSFTWTAPEAGTGEVVFYGAFVIGQPNVSASTMQVQEDESTGIGEAVNNTFSMYTDPVNNRIVFIYHLPEPSLVQFRLFDLSGRMLMEQNLGYRQAGNHTEHIYQAAGIRQNLLIGMAYLGDQTFSCKILF